MTRGSRTCRSLNTFHAVLVVGTSLIPGAAWSQSAPAMPRVRSENRMIAQLIADTPAASVTFRGLVEAINGTNGIVFVESGQCGHGVQSCLTHIIHVAEPNRFLFIKVNLRRDCTELMGAIGHELHHALDVLRDPGITTTQDMFFHPLHGMSMSSTGRFERNAAVEAEMQIERELRKTPTRAGASGFACQP
jgi:hypothetical protein